MAHKRRSRAAFEQGTNGHSPDHWAHKKRHLLKRDESKSDIDMSPKLDDSNFSVPAGPAAAVLGGGKKGPFRSPRAKALQPPSGSGSMVDDAPPARLRRRKAKRALSPRSRNAIADADPRLHKRSATDLANGSFGMNGHVNDAAAQPSVLKRARRQPERFVPNSPASKTKKTADVNGTSGSPVGKNGFVVRGGALGQPKHKLLFSAPSKKKPAASRSGQEGPLDSTVTPPKLKPNGAAPEKPPSSFLFSPSDSAKHPRLRTTPQKALLQNGSGRVAERESKEQSVVKPGPSSSSLQRTSRRRRRSRSPSPESLLSSSSFKKARFATDQVSLGAAAQQENGTASSESKPSGNGSFGESKPEPPPAILLPRPSAPTPSPSPPRKNKSMFANGDGDGNDGGRITSPSSPDTNGLIEAMGSMRLSDEDDRDQLPISAPSTHLPKVRNWRALIHEEAKQRRNELRRAVHQSQSPSALSRRASPAFQNMYMSHFEMEALKHALSQSQQQSSHSPPDSNAMSDMPTTPATCTAISNTTQNLSQKPRDLQSQSSLAQSSNSFSSPTRVTPSKRETAPDSEPRLPLAKPTATKAKPFISHLDDEDES